MATNNTPTITDLFTTTRTFLEDSPANPITKIKISDLLGVDQTLEDTLTVTFSVSHGVLNVGTTTGVTITGGGTGSITLVGTATDIDQALLNNNFTYTPAGNYNGDDSLVITVSDGVNNITLVPDSSVDATLTVPLAISAVNDAPTLTPTALTVAEGGQVTFGLDQLGLVDPDLVVNASGITGTGQQVLAQQIVKITQIPTKGTLRLGTQILQVGSVFSYDQLATVKYTHDGSDVSTGDTDFFKVIVNDGGGGVSAETTVNINLTPVNKPPTIGGSGGVYEGYDNALNVSASLGDNADLSGNATVTISGVDLNGEGRLYLDLDGSGTFNGGDTDLSSGGTFTVLGSALNTQLGKLRFEQFGNETNPNDKPRFTINVQDSGGGTGIPATSSNTTVEITVTPVNDDPILLNNHGVGNPLSVTGGSTTVLTSADLRVTDIDSPVGQLVYTLQSRPGQGIIQLDIGGGTWKTLGIGGFFTQADIDAGRVRYVQQLGNTGPDSFDFKVRDSALTIAPNGSSREGGVRNNPTDAALAVKTFNINITTVNPTPLPTPGNPDPGYGGTTPGAGSPTIDPNVTFTNNNFTNIAVGDRAQEGGSGIITKEMLNFVFVNSNAVQVPPQQTVYTLLNLPSNGTLQQWNGTSWVNFSVGSTFTQADINKGILTNTNPGAGDTGMIRFVHNGSEDFTSTFDYSVSVGGEIRINTQTDPNDAYKPFTLDIIPVNDDPSISQAKSIALQEGATKTILPAEVVLSDVDGVGSDKPNDPIVLLPSDAFKANANIATFKVPTLPTNGVLFIDNNGNNINDAGDTVININTVISKADLNNGKVKFDYDSGFNTNSFTPTLTVTPYDASNTALANVDILFSPEKFAFQNILQFQVTDLPDYGTLFIDANGNSQFDSGEAVQLNTWYDQSYLSSDKLLYTHNGTENFLDNFIVQGKDNHGALSGLTTVKIDIFPVNDAPQVPLAPPANGSGGTGINQILMVNEGTTGTITNSLLQAVDPDNTTTQRQFRVTDNVDNGTLFLNGRALGVGSTFTQKDIDDGKLSYKHDGLEVFTDRFYFTVSDGDKTTDVAYFDININPLNDKPTLTTPASLDVTAANNPSSITYVAVPGVSVTDVDLDSIATSGETDFLRVELQVLDGSNNLVTGALLNYTAADPTSSLKFILGKDTNSLIVQGTKAEIGAVLASLQIGFTNDENANNYKIKVTVDDRLYNSSGALTSGANGGASNQDGTTVDATNNRVSKDILLNVSNENDPPTLTNGTTYIVNEDGSTTLSGFTLTDPDSFDKDVTVVVELYKDLGTTPILADASTQGRLQLGATTGLTSSAGNDTNTITLVGSVAEVLDALNALKVNGVNDFNNGPLYVKTTVTDFNHAGGSQTASVTNTVNVVPINDAPVLTVPGSPFNLVGGASNISLSGVSFTDIKDVSQGATDSFTVTVNDSTGLGNLSISGTPGITGENTGTLTLTGTQSQINIYLSNLLYTPNNPNADNTATLIVTVNDAGNGDEGGTSTGNQTATGNLTVRISNSNDAPVNIILSPLIVVEDSSNNSVTGIQISDSDDFGANLTVVLTPTNGTINFSGTPTGVTVTGAGTSVSPYQLVGTKSAINAYLNTLRFTPTSNLHGASGIASIRVFTTDTPLAGSGLAKTDTDDYYIAITPLNDRPTATNSVTLSPTNASTEDAGTTQPSVAINTLNFGYSDATDTQTGTSNTSITPNVVGSDTATPFSYIAIVGNAAIAAQGTWQVSDGSSGWITIPASGLSTTNALIFPSNRQVRFVPAANFHGTPGQLSVRLADNSVTTLPVSSSASNFRDLTAPANGNLNASDNSSAWNDTDRLIATTVTNVNDSPTAGNRNLAVNEDITNHTGNTVSGIGFGYSDALDNRTAITGGGNAATPFGGIAIVENAATAAQGTWQYSTNGGTTWNAIATPSDSSALILPTTARLRFLPAANFNGLPGSLSIRVADTVQSFATGVNLNDTNLTGNLTLGQSSTWSNTVALGSPVTKLNDAPVIAATINNPTAQENNTTGTGSAVDAVNLLTGSSLSDIDLTTTGGLSSTIFGAGTITVSLNSFVAGDILQINSLPGIASTTGGSSSNLVITLANTATLAQVQTILDSLQYRSSSDNPTLNGTAPTRTYTVVVNDGRNIQAGGNADGNVNASQNSNTLTGTITINAVNDKPQVVSSGTTTFTEGNNVLSTPIAVNSGLTLTDVDNSTLASATLTITGNFQSAEDVLSFTSNAGLYGNIAASYNAGVLTLTSAGQTATLAQWQAALQSVTYTNLSENPNNGDRTIQIVVNDGTDSSVATTRTIQVVPVNDTPILGTGSTTNYLENDPATAIAPIMTLTNADTDLLKYNNGSTLTIAYASGATVADQLSIAQTNGITVSGNNVLYNGNVIGTFTGGTNGTGLTITFNGVDSTSVAVQQLLKNISFSNTSDAPTAGNRVFNITINDNEGGLQTATKQTTINVIPVNDAPEFSGNATLTSLLEDPTVIPGDTLSNLFTGKFVDPDAGASLSGVAIVGNTANALTQGSWQYSTDGTNWFDIGIVADGATALALSAGSKVRFVPVADYNATTAPALEVRALDDTYTGGFTSGANRQTVNTAVNGGITAIAGSTDFINTSVTPVNDVPSVAIPGTTQTLGSGTSIVFSTANGNAIAIDDLKDLNNNGVDNFIVTLSVTDGINLYGTLALAGTAGLTINGNGTGTVTLTGTKANINAALDGLVYTPPTPNLGNNNDVTANLSILLNDLGNGSPIVGTNPLTAQGNVLINISSTNDAPIVINPVSVVATEDTPFNFVGAGLISFNDPDDFGNQMEITLSVGKGTLTFGTLTGLTFSAGDGTADSTLTFRGTESNLNAALASLSYLGNANYNTVGTSKDVLNIAINDLGNTGQGGINIVNRNINISVTPVNDAPIASGSSDLAPVNENTASTGQLISSLFAGNYNDLADTVVGGTTATPLKGIAIIGNSATAAQGKWQYTTTASSTVWTDIPTTLSDSAALVLPTTYKIRFLPAADFSGVPAPLDILVSDGLGFVASTNTTTALKNISGANRGGASGWSASSVQLNTSVLPVNDAPVIDNLDGDVVNYALSTTTGFIKLDNPRTLATMTDPDTTLTYEGFRAGGQFTVSLQGAGVDTTGDLLGLGGFVSVATGTVFINGTAIGTLTSDGTNGILGITFNSNITDALADILVQNITYKSNGSLGARLVDFSVTDGDTSLGVGTEGISSTVTSVVTVTQDPLTYNFFEGTDRSETIGKNIGTNNDVIFGRGANDILYGYAGDDILFGGDGSDTIDASDGDDLLFGGTGNDLLRAGRGNDYLVGGEGKDTLTGNEDADKFVFQSLNDSLFATFDRITDLHITTQSDKLVVPKSISTNIFENLGNITSLTATTVQSKTTALVANSAGYLTMGTRTFVVLNDGIAGFQAASDGFIEITGYTGTLTPTVFSQY